MWIAVHELAHRGSTRRGARRGWKDGMRPDACLASFPFDSRACRISFNPNRGKKRAAQFRFTV